MDGCSGKRTADGLVLPRKASGLVLRENMNKKDDKNAPVCSRIGCTARISSMKGTQVGSTGNKSKSARPSLRSSSNGKEISRSSSRTPIGFGNTKTPPKDTSRKQLSSSSDADSSETCSVHDLPETYGRIPPRGKSKGGALSVHSEKDGSGKVVLGEAGSSSRGTSRSYRQRSDLGTRDALTGPSISLSSGNSRQTARGNLSKNGLRNLRCNSISDVVPSDSSATRRMNIFRKKNSNSESSSSSRGNKMARSVPEGRNQNSPHGISISDSRRQRNLPTNRDNNSAVSITTRRSAGFYGRTGHLGAGVSPAAIMQVHQPATPADNNPTPSAELSFRPSSSYSRPSNSSDRFHRAAPGSPSEVSPSRSLMNRDGISRSSMNGIAEVLLALDRIEQDEELTYEQLVVLETNLFFSGMNSFYDQHRDMRLDIDNMSYEELLALEERMGTVSTALSEEALSRSLKTSVFKSTDETYGSCLDDDDDDDDVKCSICQEEYVGGEELGSLKCQHKYHASCIQQWLRMKNWCPICKTSAESPPHIRTDSA
ncbi:PREDICTED: E3 ubiquitin-protein ligase MBR1-like [Tarenaya hassleriana]|uniref:E3 ubiquitin-protein ligase MBR1-like n=1 Tax=Tarenaya hassleriana TaxID=28532 RepID=UPI00053C77F1|nr:PREDICTED: E3 ubiquitin-protein ligase MBR1-like [Tarenaya hassleriana]XP_010519598.1 PREDICTED: E3 ubiquitin-protein ligase MBR1-like [Tarenaya hassleriana]XP_010519599.1 PREDICTED: E3 ubiquitin-protein ligase MBR1-like [Tarenaya hassleriana]